MRFIAALILFFRFSGRLVTSDLITIRCLVVIFNFALFYIANELSYHLWCKRAPEIHVKWRASVQR